MELNQDEESSLDDILHAATEAGIRLPFTVADLRRWAQQRRRVPKGHEERSGRFLPEVDLPEPPKPRASRRAVARQGEAADELDLPPEGAPKTRATPWGAVGHKQPEDIKAAETKEADRLAREKAAAQKLGATSGLSLAKKYSNSTGTQAKNARLAVDKVNAAAEAVGNKPKQPWLKDMINEALKEVTAAEKIATAQEAIALAARAKAEANPKSAVITNREGRNAEAALKKAEAARKAADAAARKATKAANYTEDLIKTKQYPDGRLPRPKFAEAEQAARFKDLEPGYRIATPREFYERWGNTTEYSGMWIHEDPNHYKPTIKFKPTWNPKGKSGDYTPQWEYDQERKKWKRIERLAKVYPDIHKHLIDTINNPKTSPNDRANALATFVTLQTGARPGSDAGLSNLRDERHPLWQKGKPPSEQVKLPTYGSSTLLNEHATVIKDATGKPTGVKFKFLGKSGIINDIVVKDPDFAAQIDSRKRNSKKGDRLFPDATSDKMAKLLGPYGFDMSDFKETAKSPGEEEAEAAAAGPLEKFKIKDLRTLQANTFAEDYFQKIMDAHNRIPENHAEWVRWMNAAIYAASQDLGNQYNTFSESYLSQVPFLDAINAMIEREKKKSRNKGPLNPEDYWMWGKKNKFAPGTGPRAVKP